MTSVLSLYLKKIYADRSFGEAWARRGSRSFGPGSVGTYLGSTVGAGIFHDFPSWQAPDFNVHYNCLNW